jgi:hypothetical protein
MIKLNGWSSFGSIALLAGLGRSFGFIVDFRQVEVVGIAGRFVNHRFLLMMTFRTLKLVLFASFRRSLALYLIYCRLA